MVDIVVKEVSSKADLFIGCIGFEDRSTYILRTAPDYLSEASIVLFDYNPDEIFSYRSNISQFERLPYKTKSLAANIIEFEENIRSRIRESDICSVVFDVTSFDREKIGVILQILFQNRNLLGDIRLVYCPRSFEPVPLKFDVVQSFGPVLPVFMGEVSFSRRSLSLILGAGYEYGRAVGAIDTLEPDNVFCFRPTGTDPRFDQFIDKANVDFNFIDDPDHVLFYDLLSPQSLYFNLRRLVEFENAQHNVLILPLGPKIFAAISMLIALILHPAIMVWRHSTSSVHQPGSICDAKATGMILNFGFRFV